MSTKDRREGKDSEELKKLGFELNPPVDDYSSQPDSGSRMGDARGRQEYGIEGEIASENDPRAQSDEAQDTRPLDGINVEAIGVSEFSEEATHGVEGFERAAREEHHQTIPDDYLESLIRERLEHHDRIDASSISIMVVHAGIVVLTGGVRSHAENLRVVEVVSAIPGVEAVDNRLSVEEADQRGVHH
jgi:osmotically-inducible protein OsmY